MKAHRSDRISDLGRYISSRLWALPVLHVSPSEYTEGPPVYTAPTRESFYRELPISYSHYRIIAYRRSAVVVGLNTSPFEFKEAIFIGDIDVLDEIEAYLLFHGLQ